MIRAADYGRALFELAWQERKDGEIGEEMARVRTILEGPGYCRLLDSPALPREQRLLLLEQAFSSLSPYHLNFLKILWKSTRCSCINMPPAPRYMGSCMTRLTRF